MMNNLLSELWRGELASLKQKASCSAQIKNAVERTEMYRDAIEKLLTDQQAEFFDSYANCAQEYADRIAEEAFCEGFRLAVRLMSEALHGNSAADAACFR